MMSQTRSKPWILHTRSRREIFLVAAALLVLILALVRIIPSMQGLEQETQATNPAKFQYQTFAGKSQRRRLPFGLPAFLRARSNRRGSRAASRKNTMQDPPQLVRTNTMVAAVVPDAPNTGGLPALSRTDSEPMRNPLLSQTDFPEDIPKFPIDEMYKYVSKQLGRGDDEVDADTLLEMLRAEQVDPNLLGYVAGGLGRNAKGSSKIKLVDENYKELAIEFTKACIRAKRFDFFNNLVVPFAEDRVLKEEDGMGGTNTYPVCKYLMQSVPELSEDSIWQDILRVAMNEILPNLEAYAMVPGVTEEDRGILILTPLENLFKAYKLFIKYRHAKSEDHAFQLKWAFPLIEVAKEFTEDKCTMDLSKVLQYAYDNLWKGMRGLKTKDILLQTPEKAALLERRREEQKRSLENLTQLQIAHQIWKRTSKVVPVVPEIPGAQ